MISPPSSYDGQFNWGPISHNNIISTAPQLVPFAEMLFAAFSMQLNTAEI